MSGDVMMFPDTVEEFMEQYKVVDREQVYSNGIEFVPIFRMQQWFDHVKHSRPDDLRPVGKWEDAGKQMLINLENAREQYSVLGYPHRTELKRRCSVCRKITLVDSSIEYKYCPHCGAVMSKGE